jgi:hypothetical protein
VRCAPTIHVQVVPCRWSSSLIWSEVGSGGGGKTGSNAHTCSFRNVNDVALECDGTGLELTEALVNGYIQPGACRCRKSREALLAELRYSMA